MLHRCYNFESPETKQKQQKKPRRLIVTPAAIRRLVNRDVIVVIIIIIIILLLHQYHVRLYQPLKRDAIQLRFTALQWQVRDFNFKAADEEKTERVWWAETCNRGFSWDSVEAVSAGGIH